jgi:anti-sigma B factor antagonist
VTASAVDRTYTETPVAGRTEIRIEAHAQDFALDTHREGGVQVVVVRGELDMATAPLLRSVLATVGDRLPPRVELDLSGVTFLDAYALAVLHIAVRSTPPGRRLALRNPSRAVRRVLHLSGLETAFPGVAPAPRLDRVARRAG